MSVHYNTEQTVFPLEKKLHLIRGTKRPLLSLTGRIKAQRDFRTHRKSWQSQEQNCLLGSAAKASARGQAAGAGEKPSLSQPCFRSDWEKETEKAGEREGKEIILVVKLWPLVKREKMFPN